ncbi:right-handed parallel beta-helix repeat-containing protein [Azospirillum thermophilum]|uniref:Right handed beta helix domain-containing protein n=1 Tax=Azospirillum thermophilum TaxID=2202148 RepID=A0A2S2CVR3_9PROT|nr:right-handed parallel beta-helix repeat-containing protein [Azospirillum thermophilum]AWK88470.1 hypothetical protein DEW08_20615 [Azospirillum thermophilum]
MIAALLPLRLSGALLALAVLGMPSVRPSAALASATHVVAPDGDDRSRGSMSAPLRSLGEAARRARAGDRVLIRPGVYRESVEIVHDGRPDAPILFEAEEPGTVVISGETGGFQPQQWVGDHDPETRSGNPWVTLKGLVFRQIGERPAVRAATGWRIESCLFEQVGFGVNIRGNDVTVSASLFQDIDSPTAHAIVGAGGRNLRIADVTIRRINTKRLIASVANSAVTKFLGTDGLVVERLVSEDNVGPGLWLDTANRNFVIRNSVIRRNTGNAEGWEGPGIWIEYNRDARGRVHDNVVMANSSAGIELLESSGVVIENNVLLDNPACVAFRNMPRGEPPATLLGDLRIHGNLCGGWTTAAVATGPGLWDGFDATKHGIAIDRNRYLVPRAGGQAGPLFSWIGETAGSLAEATRKFGFEAQGLAQ